VRAPVTGSRFPRLESTLTGATGVRVGAPARGRYFALGLLVAGGVAIASLVIQLADPGGGGAVAPRRDQATTPPPDAAVTLPVR